MNEVPPPACHAARGALWPPERPRLHSDAEARAWAHVRSCPACSRHFLRDRAFLEALSDMPGNAAPVEVREATFAALTAARGPVPAPRAGPARKRIASIPTYVVVLLSAVTILMAGPNLGDAGTGQAAAQDYLRRVVAGASVETSDPAVIRRFVLEEVGLSFAPLSGPGLTLQGAEICLLEGVRSAVVEYRVGDGRISHYLRPAPASVVRPPAVTRGGTDKIIPGLPVVTWTRAGIEHVLLGERPPARLMELARTSQGG